MLSQRVRFYYFSISGHVVSNLRPTLEVYLHRLNYSDVRDYYHQCFPRLITEYCQLTAIFLY